MTDNEIIKALECRVKDKCPECPYFHSYPCDKCRNMQTDALDLINRQKAEIEKMKDEYRWLDQESDILQADVENLSRMCDEVNAENENLKAEIKDLQDLMVKYNADFAKQEAEIDDLKRNDLPRCKDALRRANEMGTALEKENQELKAEIERLKDILIKLRELHDRAKGIIATQNGEIAELKDELLESNIEIAELYKCKFSAEDVAQNIIIAKAEAYKEFWNSRPERLNEQCEGKEEYNKGWNACLDEFWEIRNNLFEELVGDKDES